MSKFINFHGHSYFSLQDAVGHPKNIITASLDKGMNAIALTEHGHMNSFAPFYLFAKKNAFKGIYGCEFYFIDSIEQWNKLKLENDKNKLVKKEDDDVNSQISEDETESRKIKKNPLKQYSHLLIIAQNIIGLKNLFKLVNHAFVDGFYYRPRIDLELLKRFNEGLICTSACCVGPLSKLIVEHEDNISLQKEIVDNKINDFVNIFGNDRFYLELQWNKLDFQHTINKYLIDASKRFNLKLISTVDYHYPKQENFLDRIILKNTTGFYAKNEKIDTSITLDDLDCELWIKNDDDLRQYFQKLKLQYIDNDLFEQTIINTYELNEKIDDIEVNTKPKLLKIYSKSFEKLVNYCLNEINVRNLNNDEYNNRLYYELNILKELEIKKGLQYADYFFLMKEIIDICKKEMLVGCGRGSSAGSLICYLLNITTVDPIKFDLSFDRFISIDRAELPDIDTDFSNPQRAREIVIERFGEKNVAYISNYGTLQLKNCLKDVCRSFGIEFDEVNRLNKIIENEIKPNIVIKDKSLFTYDWETAKKYSKSLQDFLKKYPHIDKPIENLIGAIRNVGTHAAGICIANDIGYEMPILCNKKRVQTSYTEGVTSKHLSEMGFIKFDILGLNTLNIINNTLKILSNNNENKYNELLNNIHPANINFDDIDVYKTVYHDGNFTSIFQFDSTGMRNLCKKIKPVNIFELSDIISIYRPGPLEANMDQLYFENRKNPSKIEYDHPILKEILSKTYGTCLYQEQVMAICNKLGKMSIVDTNAVRKYFVKRSREALSDVEALKTKGNELYTKFVNGVNDEKLANKLWDQFEGWTSYGFNKAHSMSYAIISYQTAYLRTKYPNEFALSVLNNDFNEKNLFELIQQNFQIDNININESKANFYVESSKIKIPFSIIKGVGDAALKQLEILQNEKITSFQQFLDIKNKLKLSKINKRVIEGLIKAGAFDTIENNHAKLYKIIEYNQLKVKDKKEIDYEKFIEVDDFSQAEKISFEQEVLGISINNIKKVKNSFELDLDYVSFNQFNDDTKNLMLLKVMNIEKRQTKFKKTYLILTCVDNEMKIEKIKHWNNDQSLNANNLIYGYVIKDDYGYVLNNFVKI